MASYKDKYAREKTKWDALTKQIKVLIDFATEFPEEQRNFDLRTLKIVQDYMKAVEEAISAED